MQVRPQRDWPRARSIQGLLQQRDGGMYARARLARSHPGVEKTFDRRHGATGKHRHASDCGSVRGSVEGAARGSRASREGDSSRRTRAEPSGIDRVAAKERVTRGWSSSHPAHARVPHRIHGRHRGSNMPMSRQDLTLVRTAQSSRPLVTCPEGGGQPQSVHSHNRSPPRVARPSAVGVPTVRGRSRHPRAALRPRAAAPAAKDRVTKSSGGRGWTSARQVG